MWVGDFVTDSTRVFVDFMIIATLVALVSEEMNFIIFLLNVLEAPRFVPSLWEHIKRYLTTD